MNRKDFPLLEKTVYLDSAAGALKPKQVVDAITKFYLDNPINPHSIDSKIGSKVLKQITEAKELVADLIGAATNEVIWTSGTTDSLNRIAVMFKAFLKEGDEILISKYNHASNIVPWIEVSKLTGSKVVYVENLFEGINENTKVVCYSQENNSLYQHIDKERLYKEVRKAGAVLVNDAAQAIMHEEVSLHDSDVIVFSGNKLYGPTGIGVLAVRKELLEVLKPATFGGGATGPINGLEWVQRPGTTGFETGTLNTAGIIGLGEAVKYFNNIDLSIEKEIADYLFDELSKVDRVKVYSRRGDRNVIFNVEGINSQDVASYLGHRDIIIRSGSHCAKLVGDIIDIESTSRASIAAYNTKEDIDKFIKELKNGGDFIDFV